MKCPNCGSTDIDTDSSRGDSACMSCGTIMHQNAIVSEVGFVEGANGASSVLGQFVPSTGGARLSASAKTRGPGGRGPSVGYQKDSREHTIQNGRKSIQHVADHLRLRPHHVDSAVRLFMLAVQHNFIQGRRTAHVVAACLYIVCRREKTPHLLIDFSDCLQINLYVLGATFLKFVRLLNLSLPIIDPSLYIHRFAAQLELRDAENRDKTHMVAMTALRLVARMKRDWMLIGRRPSGICGASLLIAARIHGFKRTQKEIIYIVKICDMTLRKRLLEFSNTSSSQLTLEEFEKADVEMITHSKAQIKADNDAALAREGPNALLKPDPFGPEQDPPAFTRNRIMEREEKNILASRAKMLGEKETLLRELELDNEEKLQQRLMPGRGAASAAAAAGYSNLSAPQLLLGAGSQPADAESARDLEIQQIQSESRLLLDSDPGISASIVAQIEEMMEDRRVGGFAELDEGPQRQVSSIVADGARVHVTPLSEPLAGSAAAAAAASSSAAAAASPAIPAPSQTQRLKSIHKGPNLNASRVRRGTTGAGATPHATPLHSSLLSGKDAPPFDLSSILPPPAAVGSVAEMKLFRKAGNPLADAMMVASDPALHMLTPAAVAVAAAAAAAAAGTVAASASAPPEHMSVNEYLASTMVDPDLSNWLDLADLDDEIDSRAILLSEAEVQFKTQAWEQIHKEWLAEQEEKKQMAAQGNAGEGALGPDGQPLPPRRHYKKKLKHAAGPAATAAEATMRLLAEKKYSDKINYNALKGLLTNEIAAEEKEKKEKQQQKEEDDDDGDDDDDEDDDEDDDDSDEEDADDDDAAAADGDEAAGASALSGKKRGGSSISAAQLPSAKQQRRAPASSNGGDDDEADGADGDDGDEGMAAQDGDEGDDDHEGDADDDD